MTVRYPDLPGDPQLNEAAAAAAFERVSDALAAAFSAAAPAVLAQVGTEGFLSWITQIRSLHQDRPGDAEVAIEFAQAGPALFERLTGEDVKQLAALLTILPSRPAMVVQGALAMASGALPALPPAARSHTLRVATHIAETNPWSISQFFELVSVLLPRLRGEDQGIFLDSLAPLAALSPMQLTNLLKDAAGVPASVTADQLGALLPLASRIALRSGPAAQELLRSAADLFARLEPEQLEPWSQPGQDLLGIHPAAAMSYFRLQSRLAQDALAAHSSGVALTEVRDVLRLYCQALMGRSLAVLSTEQLQEGHAGWAGGEMLGWEGAAVFAPPVLRDFKDKQANFEGYKVLATHQAGHLLFRTYDFDFTHPGALLRSLRPLAAPRSGPEAKFASEYERFFDLFSNQRLARDLFALAEDERIDAAITREYRGIRHPYARIQESSLEGRPDLTQLPVQLLVLEILVRHSLNRHAVFRVPKPVVANLDKAVRMLNLMSDPVATPMDAAEAAMRLYVWVTQTPNVPSRLVPPGQWTEYPLSQEGYDAAAEGIDALAWDFARANPLEVSAPGAQQQDDGEEEAPFMPAPPVSYRADPRPEAMQELMKHLEQEGDVSGMGSSPDETAMELLRDMVSEDDSEAAPGDLQDMEAVPPTPQRNRPQKNNGRPGSQTSPLVDSVAENDVQVFYYDEWDYRIRSYRPSWCRLHQRTLKEGGEEFYDRTISQHHGLVHALRKQFEMLRPEGITKVKRLMDGEEFDLDAVIESVVDKRAGYGVHDKVYWRRLKSERSVAVAFLLDMSLSTDERVDQDLRQYAPLAGNDPVASPYRRPGAGKRIIDLEKEGLGLFIEALERLGDTYGIYGFSSSGRGDVQFFVVKDTEESYSSHVRGRLDKIVPLQGTRMGAAVRHTVTKLEKIDARTRVLLMLSDGRPQDRDYGTLPWELEEPHRERTRGADPSLNLMGADGVMTDEKDYAVHDTKMAFNEAKAKGITPFCISIDKEGHDYLKAMCGDIGYEVVSEIESLPRRVPALYRRLTT